MLKYGEVTQEDIQANVEVSLTFSIEYEMENSVSHAIEVGQKFPSFYPLCFTSVSWQHFCLSLYVQTIPAATLRLLHSLIYLCSTLSPMSTDTSSSYLPLFHLFQLLSWPYLYLYICVPLCSTCSAVTLCLLTIPILLCSILSFTGKYVRSKCSVVRLGCGMYNPGFESW